VAAEYADCAHNVALLSLSALAMTEDRAERHRGAGYHRAEQQCEERVEQARRDGRADHVGDEGKEQILADVVHR
jgi:hypothetical protein